MVHFEDSQIEEIRKFMLDVKTVGELQIKINDRFKTHLTYLETRLLVDDYGLKFLESKENIKNEDNVIQKDIPNAVVDGSVKVSIASVAIPGKMINGDVTFSDGQNATWEVDQFGRLAIHTDKVGYKPSQIDLEEFQKLLQQKMTEEAQKKSFELS